MTELAVKALGFAIGIAVVSACSGSDDRSNPAYARFVDDSDGDDWPGFGHTFGEQHFSPLSQIDETTIADLGLAWAIDLPAGNSVSAPIEVDGVLYYVTGYGVVHAVDAATGNPFWKYDPETYQEAAHKLGVGWGSRGIAWWNGKIYVGTQAGRLIAIDAKSGKPVWNVMTVEPDDYNYITAAPRVFGDKVIIGFGGADVGPSRGYVTAYDASTGKLIWRFHTVPGDPAKGFENAAMEMAAKSWAGEWWKNGGGGTVWNAISYDPETDMVFVGVGNGTPWNHKARSAGEGDNLFLASIVALEGKTGTYKWHYQVNPGETWDWAAAMDMALATLTIEGKPRKVVMQAPKNGFFYVIDRLTGKLISAEPFAKVNWASRIDLVTGRPVENPAARYPDGTTFTVWPGSGGAHGWHPMAFSPKTNLVYIPVTEGASSWSDFGVRNGEWRKAQPIGTGQTAAALGPPDIDDPLNRTSRLDAWDPVAQKRVWSHRTVGSHNGGILATGGNLVFQGQLDGTFNAYLASTGKPVWSFQTNAPVIAPPISFAVNGKQYITVQTGLSTSTGLFGEELAPFRIDYRTQARRVLTFSLGGRMKLPLRQEATLNPIEDPDYRLDVAMTNHGGMIFNGRCMQCHGYNAVAAGSAPDLRTSNISLSPEAFKSVVHGGALLPANMPRFDKFTDTELEAIRQYIRSRARQWRDEERHGSTGQ